MKYSAGTHAKGQCRRCGQKRDLSDLVLDGRFPNMLVCTSCRDIQHPQEKPIDATDPQILKRPAPDLDDDSPGDSGERISEAMGFTNSFGGET